MVRSVGFLHKYWSSHAQVFGLPLFLIISLIISLSPLAVNRSHRSRGHEQAFAEFAVADDECDGVVKHRVVLYIELVSRPCLG